MEAYAALSRLIGSLLGVLSGVGEKLSNIHTHIHHAYIRSTYIRHAYIHTMNVVFSLKN